MAKGGLVAPVAPLLQATEVVAESWEDRCAVAALYVADEGVWADEAVARIFGDRANDPTKDAIIDRARAQFDQTFGREVIELRWTRQDGSAVEITPVGRSNRIQFLAPFCRESLRRVEFNKF